MTCRLLTGDAESVLRTLPAGSVQCCVTSPPYFGLRDYGTATWDGGDPACVHRVGNQVGDSKAPKAISSGMRPGTDASHCKLCGARRIDQQIGLEDTPEAYIARLVAVFREVRRVLADSGTCWINVGDSYFPHNGTRGNKAAAPDNKHLKAFTHTGHISASGIKGKDLIGIPWMLAFALRADGWYLRSDIVWAKPAPMPESVTDRPTRSHEYLFLLSKKQNYFYDAEAIKEENSSPQQLAHNLRYAKTYDAYDSRVGTTGQPGNVNSKGIHSRPGGEGRNKRDVWTINTAQFPGAHYAVMPPKLVEPCILAGSREGDTVLDPFSGSGTVGLVACSHNRHYIGIDLDPKNIPLARQRIGPMLLDIPREACS